MEAPDKATDDHGSASRRATRLSLDGKKLSPATLLASLNDLGRDNGIGRIDLVENRFVGMKSRGVYETPGGTILLAAHRAMESITLDRGAGHLKDELMPRYAELIYNGFWFAPEREMLQALIDKSQEHVEGEVTLKLYKGNVIVTGRDSPKSLYSSTLVTFEDDKGAYDQKDAEGFIRLNALRLRTLGHAQPQVILHLYRSGPSPRRVGDALPAGSDAETRFQRDEGAFIRDSRSDERGKWQGSRRRRYHSRRVHDHGDCRHAGWVGACGGGGAFADSG